MTSDNRKPTAVKAADTKAGGAYESLALALEGRFDAPLEALPGALRERVERAFPPVSWGMLSAEQRRHRAREWDCEHDPAAEEERQRGFDSAVREHGIESKLRQLELMNPRTPLELESKNRQLDGLRRERTELQGAGLSTPEGKGAGDGFGVFRSMRSLTADEVVITFLSGDDGDPMMEIGARGKRQRAHPAELDLMDHRGGTLNAQGEFLLALANRGKQMHSPKKAQTVSRLRKSLKMHIGVLDDPFERYRSGSGAGWEPRFKVYDKCDAADKRAERETARKTVSYDALMSERGKQFRAGGAGDAAEWLEEHDPGGQE